MKPTISSDDVPRSRPAWEHQDPMLYQGNKALSQPHQVSRDCEDDDQSRLSRSHSHGMVCVALDLGHPVQPPYHQPHVPGKLHELSSGYSMVVEYI